MSGTRPPRPPTGTLIPAEFCFVDEPQVRTTALGDHAGLYGALVACRTRLDSLVAD